jgi:hypothetical protein
VSESKTCRENESTSRGFAARKSTPKIGLETAARMKEQMKVRRPKDNVFFIDPQEGMERPSAPVSGGPEGAAEERCGKTLKPGACINQETLFRRAVLEVNYAAENVELPEAAA